MITGIFQLIWKVESCSFNKRSLGWNFAAQFSSNEALKGEKSSEKYDILSDFFLHSLTQWHTHTRTHTHIHIHMYIHVERKKGQVRRQVKRKRVKVCWVWTERERDRKRERERCFEICLGGPIFTLPPHHSPPPVCIYEKSYIFSCLGVWRIEWCTTHVVRSGQVRLG